jgi:6-phosphogluconolactonase
MMANHTSSDHHRLFVGSYSPPDKPGVRAFDFDEASGTLTDRGSLPGIANPSYLILHPNMKWMYSVSETAQATDGTTGGVVALRFDSQSLAAEIVNQQPSGGDWPCHLRLDPTGKWLIVSNYGSGSVGLLPLKEDGSLDEMAHLVQHHGGSVNPARQEGPHAHSSNFTPDGGLLIVADLGLDRLMLYRLDAAAGKLVAHGEVPIKPGSGPRHMTFGPNGDRLYLATEMGCTVVTLGYDAASGAFRELQTLDTLPPGAPETTVADIHLTPDASRLYVSNRGHDSLAVYEVGADGLLKTLGFRPCAGQTPRNFAVSPNGRFVLVANQDSGGVDVLPILPGGDELGEPVTRAAVPGASCIQFLQ